MAPAIQPQVEVLRSRKVMRPIAQPNYVVTPLWQTQRAEEYSNAGSRLSPTHCRRRNHGGRLVLSPRARRSVVTTMMNYSPSSGGALGLRFSRAASARILVAKCHSTGVCLITRLTLRENTTAE